MTQEFSLDQKKVTILAALVLLLVLFVFIAGYLSGTIVGLPETEEQPVVLAPAVKPRPKPPVVAMQVPQVEEVPETEEVEEIAEPEPEPVAVPVEKLYSVQVGAFKTQARAETQEEALTEKGYQPYVYLGANSKGAMWYTVRVGDYDDVDDAIAAAREFRVLEGTSVVLTHYDSLMMVRDDGGRRIEIAPPEEPAPIEPAADEETTEDESETAVDEPETVMDEPEAAVDEPETAVDEPETAVDQADSTPENQITFALPATPPVAKDKTTGGESEGVGGLIAAAEAYQFAVQVGAFLNGDNAVKFTEKLRKRGYPAYVFNYTDTSGNAWHAVRAGDFKDPDSARVAAQDFAEKEQITAIVTRIDGIKRVF